MNARLRFLTTVLVLLVLGWVLFYRQLNSTLAATLLLRAQQPNEDAFNELANARDPTWFLRRCWATGKVAHRQLVATFLKDKATAHPPWFGAVQDLVIAGTMDSDMSVRELALATLELRSDPALFACAQAQLADPDPMVRVLGVDHLRKADRQRALPVLMELLDDPNLFVLAKTESTLMRWTGEDFGVRVRMAIPAVDAQGEVAEPNAALIRQGIDRRKAWWQVHHLEFPAATTLTMNGQSPTPLLADFTLADLTGKPVRLADFKGKLVLLNFWATWCTACMQEIPDLVALQKTHGNKLAIVGIALDGVPDEHGHHPGADGPAESVWHEMQPSVIRDKVSRIVQARGINYTVLLDPNNVVGARFSGGELPTTLIIDSEGRLRRRFIGRRNVKVLEAFLAEAAQPSAPRSPPSH